MTSLLAGVFFFGIPLIFTIIFFSVSDKSASQNMVYPRLLVDLGTVLYLLKKSTFTYWPTDVLSDFHIDLHKQYQGQSTMVRWHTCSIVIPMAVC